MSPHLIDFNDGICINNTPITDQEAEAIIIKMDEVIRGYDRSHKIKVKWFEVITSLTFIFFEKGKIDIGIIETGLRRSY